MSCAGLEPATPCLKVSVEQLLDKGFSGLWCARVRKTPQEYWISAPWAHLGTAYITYFPDPIQAAIASSKAAGTTSIKTEVKRTRMDFRQLPENCRCWL